MRPGPPGISPAGPAALQSVRGAVIARTPHSLEKRRREQAKQLKRKAKAERRLARSADKGKPQAGDDLPPAGEAGDGAEPGDAPEAPEGGAAPSSGG